MRVLLIVPCAGPRTGPTVHQRTCIGGRPSRSKGSQKLNERDKKKKPTTACYPVQARVTKPLLGSASFPRSPG